MAQFAVTGCQWPNSAVLWAVYGETLALCEPSVPFPIAEILKKSD